MAVSPSRNRGFSYSMKRQVDVILGESGESKILIASKKFLAILNGFISSDIEDESPHPEYNPQTDEWMAPGDPGYPEGWDSSKEYDTSGESGDLASLRGKIFSWIEDTHREIGSDNKVQRALQRIDMAVRHHMRHETRDCLSNLRSPWSKMLEKKGLGRIVNKMYFLKGGEDTFIIMPNRRWLEAEENIAKSANSEYKRYYLKKFPEAADDWLANGWIDWLDT